MQPIRHRILRQRKWHCWSPSESPATSGSRIRIVELAIHEEIVSFDTCECGSLLFRVGQGSQAKISSADVVADAQHNSALEIIRDLPDIVVWVPVAHVAVVVVPALDTSNTVRRRLSKSFRLLPLSPIAGTGVCLVVQRQRAVTLRFHVLGLSTIVLATLLRLVGEDGNVVPRRWVPVGVVISLLRALQTVALVIPGIAIGVLASRGGSAILINLLVRRVKALVPLALKAVLIEIQRLVVSSLDFGCLLLCWVIVITSSRVRSSAIAKRRIVSVAHVLQNDLAVQVRMTNSTSMLIVPFDVELRTLIELHGSEGRAFFGDIIIVVLVLAGRLAVIPNLVA
mmetsp:Transcript_49178/g.114762  ORF Transcript_49178/g.114762 Transcript_49178/m.114762 type:complete len:340 (+) Transcript_49178:3289-4308(+)